MNVRSIDANSLFHVVPDALIVVDSSDEIVAVNSVGLELFGYESHELIGRSLDVLLCPEDRELCGGLPRHVGKISARYVSWTPTR